MEGQSLQQKEKKRRKRKGTKKIPKNRKALKISQNFDFFACPSHNVVKCDASFKKGKLLCCKHIFEWIKDNFAYTLRCVTLHYLYCIHVVIVQAKSCLWILKMLWSTETTLYGFASLLYMYNCAPIRCFAKKRHSQKLCSTFLQLIIAVWIYAYNCLCKVVHAHESV